MENKTLKNNKNLLIKDKHRHMEIKQLHYRNPVSMTMRMCVL